MAKPDKKNRYLPDMVGALFAACVLFVGIAAGLATKQIFVGILTAFAVAFGLLCIKFLIVMHTPNPKP